MPDGVSGAPPVLAAGGGSSVVAREAVPSPAVPVGAARDAAVVRRRVRVRGVVQGVGFRPFVHALAGELSLSGQVRNDSAGVLAEVQGSGSDVEEFCRRVRSDAPPLAVVEEVDWTVCEPGPGGGFTIGASRSEGGRTLVPADVATCPDCLTELRDSADRRHRHPFITCTNCGPRFTIVTGLPYDRPATTMAHFAPCPSCAAEYDDPADRRFHAQPIACHDCGPRLFLGEAESAGGDVSGADGAIADGAVPDGAVSHGAGALARARHLLADGRVVAVKGIGGYHLACDAGNPVAVARLRRRKRRGGKPFAVLVPDVATAAAIAHVDAAEKALLASPRAPIVLLRRRGPRPGDPVVADGVAPGNPDLGVMLPSTGLHHLLLGLPGDPPGPRVLVLTSGNLAGEPIVTDDAQARMRLAGIADAWLGHDREIHVPCDDSVVRVVDGAELPVRRSRGYAPLPVALPVDVAPALAAGGDLKNTFCVASGRYAWLSAHIGDMDDLATQQTFARAVAHLQELTEVRPEVCVADLHPRYRSAAVAERVAEPVLRRVQHHHAHVAAVMAEHGLDGSAPVIGIAFDGTGYGEDGAVWGGEVLLADYDGFTRFAHLGYVGLAGGDATVHRPYRMALSHLRAAGTDWDERLPCVAACTGDERRALDHQLRTGLGTVPTSSAGRLFDAVASITGLRHEVSFEAEAAMALEAAARTAEEGAPAGPAPGLGEGYPLPLVQAVDGPTTWDVGALVRAVAADVLAGTAVPVIAARFHRGLATGIVAAARAAREGTGLEAVALSGGVFCNALLLSRATVGLREAGFTVLRHRRVPPNDGGLALGQVMVGARRAGGAVSPRIGAAPRDGATDGEE